MITAISLTMPWYDSLRDWAGVLATVLAAGLALWAVVVAKRAQVAATESLARERRIDWELDLLKEMADLSIKHQVGGLQFHLALLEPGRFGLARAWIGNVDASTADTDRLIEYRQETIAEAQAGRAANRMPDQIWVAHETLDEVRADIHRLLSERM
jgi:hypothetical protein